MSLYAVMPQSLATIPNLAFSIQSWLIAMVKTPYDTDVAANYPKMSQGYSQQPDGTWKSDTGGLGVFRAKPDDPSAYERSPAIAWSVRGIPVTPKSTGMGDGGLRERHHIRLVCLPPVFTSTDGSGEPDAQGQDLLMTYVLNACGRGLYMPFKNLADGTTVSYLRFHQFRMPEVANISAFSIANHGRFDATFQLELGVSTTNG